MDQFISKIRNTKIRMSDLIIWFFGIAAFLCLLGTIVNLLFLQQSLANAIINSGSYLFSFVAMVVMPLSIISIIFFRFIANKDEDTATRKEIVSWAKLVIEHIKNSDHPEYFEDTFVPLINEILNSFENTMPNFSKLDSSAVQILELVNKDENFQENWMGQELMRLVFLVRKFLNLSLRVN